MSEVQTLIEEIGKHWGWEIGDKVRQEIQVLIDAGNIELNKLKGAIATIQGILDADPDTEEFDVAQNIITQLSGHLTRITNLETDVTRLKGDETTVGSVAYAVKQEHDRAIAAEAELQSAIETLNADENTEGSVDYKVKTAIDAEVQRANDTYVSKRQLAEISASALASIFRHALECGFNGASREHTVDETNECMSAGGGGNPPSGGPQGGDGAVL